MFLTLLPTKPRMESETRPVDGFTVDVALKPSLKDQVPELVIAPATHDSETVVIGMPNVSIKTHEVHTPPATQCDPFPLARDDLTKADHVVDTMKSDLKPCGTHTLSQAEPLTEKINHTFVIENAVSSSAGFVDQVPPPPAAMNGHIEGIPASPATRLKRRLEDTKDLIVCPGVYDGLSARIALSVGCDAMYMVSEPPKYRRSSS